MPALVDATGCDDTFTHSLLVMCLVSVLAASAGDALRRAIRAHVHGARRAQHPSPQASFPGAPPARAQIEEVESVCYWARQLIALVCGLACGMTSTQGVPGFVLFGSLHMILGAGVLRNSAAANDASAERRWALVQEGLTASVGTFLVTWTLASGRTA